MDTKEVRVCLTEKKKKEEEKGYGGDADVEAEPSEEF